MKTTTSKTLLYATAVLLFTVICMDFAQSKTLLKSNVVALDTNLVVRKAKLLTISQYGVAPDSVEWHIALSKKHVIAHLEDDSTLLKVYSKKGIEKFNAKICFIKIFNSQFTDTSVYYTYRNICNFQCAYLIAYSTYTSKFYKLYGFVNSELSSLLYDHEYGRYLDIAFPIQPKTIFEALNRNLGFSVDVNRYFKYSLNNKYYKFKGNRVCDTCCYCHLPGNMFKR